MNNSETTKTVQKEKSPSKKTRSVQSEEPSPKMKPKTSPKKKMNNSETKKTVQKEISPSKKVQSVQSEEPSPKMQPKPSPKKKMNNSETNKMKEKSPSKKTQLVPSEEPSTSSASELVPSGVPLGSVLQLKIVLRYITPLIWRRIQVINTTTFNELHYYIQEAMGWNQSHCHIFIAWKKTDNEDEQVRIVPPYMESLEADNTDLRDSDVQLHEYLSAVDDLVLYEYDMGDGWMHDVVVEKILPPPPSKAQYPKCLGGKRACPPDDCGGTDGYEHLLEVLRDPSHEEYEELISDWLGQFYPGFDPEKFDRKLVFKRQRIWMKI